MGSYLDCGPLGPGLIPRPEFFFLDVQKRTQRNRVHWNSGLCVRWVPHVDRFMGRGIFYLFSALKMDHHYFFFYCYLDFWPFSEGLRFFHIEYLLQIGHLLCA